MDLQNVSDRIEINELMAAYANALSTQKWDAWRTTFAPDAHCDYSANFGPDGTVDEAVAWLEPMIGGMELFVSQATNVVITFSGNDSATVVSMFQATMRMGSGDPAAPLYITAQGFYHDKVARTNAGWKLTERVEVPVYTRM